MPARLTIALLDADVRRRARIAHEFSGKAMSLLPLEGVREVGNLKEGTRFYLVHDDGNLLQALTSHFERLGTWKPIVAFSMRPRPGRVVAAIHMGAMDYLDEDFSELVLRNIFTKVAARATPIREAKEASARARTSIRKMTPREQEVILALSEGLSNRLIAERLKISPRTVEIHRTNALEKLGGINSYQAVRIVVEAQVRPV